MVHAGIPSTWEIQAKEVTHIVRPAWAIGNSVFKDQSIVSGQRVNGGLFQILTRIRYCL